MGIIVDIIILAIVLICVIMGYIKGLTGSLLKIVSFVLAVAVSLILFKPVANFIISKTNWDENLESTIRQMVLEEDQKNSQSGSSEGTQSTTSDNEATESKNKGSGMPSVIMNYINDAVEKAGDDAKHTIIDSTARSVAETIINGGVLITLFILTRIVLIFVKGIANLLTKLPIIKQFDKTGGIIYGILQSLVTIYILLAFISFISPMLSGTPIINGIQESYIGSALYNNNLLLKLIF